MSRGASADGERFDLDTLPSKPWKNGGGQTREIAAHPPGAGLDDFGWRLSVADIAADGPFSLFADVDRTLVLLRGAGVCLHDGRSGSVDRLDRPGAALAFAGETPIDARLVGGTTTDFNVMTRRGQWRAEVSVCDAAARIDAADALLLLCGAGRWQVDSSGAALGPWQGLLWRAPVGDVAVQPRVAPSGWLLAVRLCQDPRP